LSGEVREANREKGAKDARPCEGFVTFLEWQQVVSDEHPEKEGG
jgi:hypothetical protein